MEKQYLTRLMQDLNPQWKDHKINFEDDIIQREALERLKGIERTVGIIGQRRVGKTTLLLQFLQEKAQRLGWERTCYFSFDIREIEVREIVETFCEYILGEPVTDLDKPVHFFLDEVHNTPAWSDHVKHFKDHYNDIDFTVTGSSASNVVKGAGESLVGRFSPTRLYPFSFREFLKYHGIEVNKIDLKKIRLPERRVSIKFREYFEKGGLPELYTSNRPLEDLEENLDLVFFRDMVELFNVGRSSILKDIFLMLATQTGQKMSYNSISNGLDSDFRTVKKYVGYLEDSYLIQRSKPYMKSKHGSIRKNPKVYIEDHAYNRVYPVKDGLKAETIAFNHAKRLESPYYFKDPEVDIVLPESGIIMEVKYGKSIGEDDFKNLVKAADETGFTPYLLTKDTYDSRSVGGMKIELIPLYVFCLSV
ncbi:MAG: ATP-binding protein [Thermoplasmata archaeon]